jgi:hypothetical protein
MLHMPFLLLIVALLQSPTAAAAPVVEFQDHRLVLDAATWATLPRQRAQALDHGTRTVFEGVPLRHLLTLVHAPVGEDLRGSALCLVVRIEAADGYQVVYALAELDAGIQDRPILLADVRDGQPLRAGTGPFQIVAADEVRGGRWVRQVTRIVVVSAARTADGRRQ